jgi:tetratricopeptide (TPR) repeat protein
VEHHKKALLLNPDFKEAWTSMGQTYKDWGKFEPALEALDKVSQCVSAILRCKALALDAEHAHALYLKGMTYHAAGKHFLAQQQ